jgi:predicted ATPase
MLEHWAQVGVEEIREWNELRSSEPVTLPAFLAGTRRPLPPEARLALRDHAEELVEAIRRGLDMDEEVFLPPERALAGGLSDVVSEVHRFFRDRIVYLGPLRQDPQVVYKTAPVGAAGFIGTKGEYLATILHASRAREVLSPTEDGALERMSLADAVNVWAGRLGIADAIQTRDLGRLGIQVSVRRGGIPPVDLTSVGVGVSQLLPVIVMCLLARPGSLILLEQPELHLHPALQQRLGDFLLACARSGRQLIVETHSEYVVSRLRRRIVEDDTGQLLNTLAIYFAEQTDDASEFRRVPLNEFGGLEAWPVGFFDQASTESRQILEAALEKRDRRASQAEAPLSS